LAALKRASILATVLLRLTIRAPVVENQTGDQGLAAPIEQLLCELSRPRHGSRAMIRALLMQCMIELIRRRAAELLQSSTQPIERVAAQVGFRSRSAFSRAFEATTGLSPQRFRSQNPR